MRKRNFLKDNTINIVQKKIIPGIALLIITFDIQAQLLSTTLATVRLTETEIITEKFMNQQFDILEAQLGSALTSGQREEVFQSQINSILIEQAARRAGLQVTASELENAISLQKSALNTAISDAEYQRLFVEQTGVSWSEYRSQIEDRILQEKYVAYARADILQNTGEISEAEIQATYEQNAQSFVSPTMSRFSHIFIDLREKSASEKNTARKQIDTYLSRIRNGGTAVFDQIIGETLDDVSVNGGDFGFLISGDANAQQILGDDFVQEVFALETGDISGVVESNIGLHILQITDRRSPRLLELDNPLLPGQSLTVRQQIQQYIRAQRQQAALVQALQEIVTELRDEADIRIVEGNVSW